LRENLGFGKMNMMKGLRFSWKYAVTIVGVLIMAYLVMDFNSRTADLRRLTVQKEQVSGQVTQLARTQDTLKTQIAYATSDAAVVDWAYEEGNMVRAGDNPVVPVAPPGSTPAPTPTPAVERPVVSNWQMWMWLFVDAAPGKGDLIGE
jgi:cell division protein FtsB